jgi:hypothetical protein
MGGPVEAATRPPLARQLTVAGQQLAPRMDQPAASGQWSAPAAGLVALPIARRPAGRPQ